MFNYIVNSYKTPAFYINITGLICRQVHFQKLEGCMYFLPGIHNGVQIPKQIATKVKPCIN